MRKFIGRAATLTAITAAVILPLAGAASAQTQAEPYPNGGVSGNHCWVNYDGPLGCAGGSAMHHGDGNGDNGDHKYGNGDAYKAERTHHGLATGSIDF